MPTHIEVPDRPSSENDETQLAKYQNNYRLQSDNPFKAETVDKLVEAILNENLENFIYDSNDSPKVCSNIAAEIQTKIQDLKYDRYKIVVTMSIVEKASQSMDASMAFSWDSQRDRYSTYTFEGRTFVAYCLVFGLYYE